LWIEYGLHVATAQLVNGGSTATFKLMINGKQYVVLFGGSEVAHVLSGVSTLLINLYVWLTVLPNMITVNHQLGAQFLYFI
jgi:hypothetical protein